MANISKTPAKLAVAVTATLSAWAQAQETQELDLTQVQTQTESSYKVEKSSNHKNTQPLLDTAKTVTVIPASVMKDRNVDSLRDALRNVSGISMAAGEGGTPTGDSMSVRGFSARTDIFVDGIRDIASYTRDTYNLESVEVAKGPGSAVSGRGSTGGSINLATKTAKLDAFTDTSLRLGSASDYRAKLDSNIQLNDTSAVRVNLLSDDGEVAGRDSVENKTNAGAVSFAHGLGTEGRLTVNVDHLKQDNIPDYGLPWVGNGSNPVAALADYEGSAPPADFDNFYGNLNRDFEDIKAQSLTARYEYDLSDNTMLRAQARAGSVSRVSIVTAPRFIDISNSTDVRLSDEKTRDTKDSLQAVQLDLIGRYSSGQITHDVVAGIEYDKENFKRWNYVALEADNLNDLPGLNDLYNPDSGQPYTGLYGRDGTSQEAESTTTAIYAFDTMTLNDQWEVNTGLRYDRFDVDYQYQYDDPSLSVNTDKGFLSWNFSVVYKPQAQTSVYFGAGSSANPQGEGLTLTSPSRNNTATLDPEETKSYELGIKSNVLDERLFVTAALFKTIKDNALQRIDSTTYELGGEQEVEGLELSTTGQINDQWLVIASYTHQDSEVVKEGPQNSAYIGQQLPNTPRNSWSLWSKYDFNEKLTVGFGAQYVGERYNSASLTGRESAKSYVIYDLMVSYQWSDDLSLQLNGENLTDEDYIDQLGGGHFIPGTGRYLSLMAHYRF